MMRHWLGKPLATVMTMAILLLSGASALADDETNPLQGTVIPSFTTKSLANSTVTKAVFQKNKVTMIKLWGTFCGPCINEMPDLAKLAKVLKKDGIGVLGIVVDGDMVSARKIITRAKVGFPNIVADQSLDTHVLDKIQYVPTTIFVDSRGRVLTPYAVGSRDSKEYQRLAMQALGEIK